MKLKELIEASEKIKKEEGKAVQEAERDIEKYLRSQTATVQELCDIVAAKWDRMASSFGQVSVWQILDIAKSAILNRAGEPD